ncbi:MAG: hypothetical protein A3B99_03665 [Candidatus Yanofskybacteria bacterium RIFCSPHIGHO2_02_FULL_44_12b]|uniref:Uncharacterized protein n=2 Tax=Candidatus Yanofskyibacteriota TaxID=1752733 RepID=A0A1F8GMN2_9BACT|nr:MAG: hypothetical protein UW79_C0010G0020 [Candidatus Yanofskybacteria bacterium GW2011_GWA2_44_9]OGN04719.1 MAG: hypothetical protein A2659_01175 [Candidatus Yanofskybacteria bacterium RIFCSPHIGHO2_01_FULL_44_24]OGN15617.1 MAG: hypothetical protein A3B99_03665 [Candidatus Yanofskybacteria bacterium RIFCSPHIGHO2_02_FULL_44_12b]OGN26672.1 MAG: hypothetical protein A2925_03750 [Candidatus Yanofskybacteria bacterium RIFCSPLOWO2_01_FULL_44_22]
MFSAGAFAKFMEYFMAIPNYLENFFTSNPNLMFGSNIWVMLLGLGASVLYGVSFGRAKAVISLISLYIAFALERLFPYFDEVQGWVGGSWEGYFIRIGLFLAAYIAIFLILQYSFFSYRLSSRDFPLVSVILISALQLGFLISIIASFMPSDLSQKLLGPAYNLFVSGRALFYWAVVPIPAVLFLRA